MSLKRGHFIIFLCLYVAFLLCICVVFRKAQQAIYRPELFQSYWSAWNRSHLFPFAQNIVLNILLYTPVGYSFCGSIANYVSAENSTSDERGIIHISSNGMLMPPLVAVVISLFLGFIISVVIEHMQLYWARGTYETDDIFNNTFGTMLGASWMLIKVDSRLKVNLIWFTLFFAVLSTILLSRMLWLCYLH